MILRRLTTKFLMNRRVVLVDEQDQELGTADIYEAHQGKGLKHRALSVILYRKVNGKIEVLLQKRAMGKPVFPGLWSNSCCTNMRPGDTYLERAVSRLKEEMGIEIEQKDLRKIYTFSYEAEDFVNQGWCENELDTVMVGEWDGKVTINTEEAVDARWVEWSELKEDVIKNREKYAPWFVMIVNDSRFQAVFE